MKALQLEHPIDEHLKPVKDSDSVLTSMEVSKTKLRVKDLDITGSINKLLDEDDMASNSDVDFCTQQSIKSYVDAVPTDVFGKDLIKIMPTDFLGNDDRQTPYAVIEDDTADTLGIRAGHSQVELYAFIKIPAGYKATHVQVLASASTSNAVTCKTFNVGTGATTDLETFNFNTDQDITDVISSKTNDLVIKLTPASTSTIIYGAGVTMASE